MNLGVINPGTNGTVPQYLAVALPLTIVTAWVIIAFQSKYIFPPGTGFIKRLGWPMFLFNQIILTKSKPSEPQLEYPVGGYNY